MVIEKKMKEIVIEHGDTIALLVTAIIAVILITLELLQEKLTNIIILLILSILAFHHLRRSFKIEKMHEQIREINGTVKTLIGNTKISGQMGVVNIALRRRDVSIEEMHEEAKKAKMIFVVSRYFTAFANKTAQETFLSCLKNDGSAKIIIYSPQGSHLDVNIERDITPHEAKIKISQTLRYLKNFKKNLPKDIKERFQYRILEGNLIYTSLVGTPNKIYSTIYLNELKGEECPTIICRPVGLNENLYSIFLNEFERLWQIADLDDEIKHFDGIKMEVVK